MRILLALVFVTLAACGGAKKSAPPPEAAKVPPAEEEQKPADSTDEDGAPDADTQADPDEGGESK